MPPLDSSPPAYPPIDLRPCDAARLAQQPYPPIAGVVHPDQWMRPYGQTISRLEAPNPHTPHRRA
ncbi:MAG: hypothetical protein ACXU8U_01355 [Asticcacaulis sp.]